MVISLGSFLYDAAVIGGGLAGGLAGLHLARAGARVVIFEKEKGPHHKVCGEFLSGEGLSFLKEIGLDPFQLGATSIEGFRLHGPFQSFSTRMPQRAAGLSRWMIDEQVLLRARSQGADVRRGVLVKEIVGDFAEMTGRYFVETSDGGVYAKRIILATGKHDFKSVQERAGRDNDYVGFKMHLMLVPSLLKKLKGNCELFVFKHGYGGLLPIENGLANFSFVIERAHLRSIGTDWDSLSFHVSQHCVGASSYLDNAEPVFRSPVAIARVPYGFLRSAPPLPGVFCVGDQMAVIPSLTGDGMTIAMMTARLSAQIALASLNEQEGISSQIERLARMTQAYQTGLRSILKSQISTALIVHHLFKRPRLTDWTLSPLTKLPGFFKFIFHSTRLQVGQSTEFLLQ